MTYAVIDVGTNTVRLLVAEVVRGRVVDVVRDLEITRLGQDVDAARRLRADAIRRTVGAVAAFAVRARDHGVQSVRVVGTSALRDAADQDAFARDLEAETGLELEILEGEQEGRICFLGASAGLDDGPTLVCDIGGGSTEFIRGDRYVEAVWSADIGSVRLKERYLTSDPPTAGEIRGAITLVEQELLQVERDVGLVGDERLVGVAGTVTQLAALVHGLETYDPARIHGTRLPATEVAAWTQRLLTMTTAQVKSLSVVHPGRADVLSAGALVLDQVMRRWGFEDVLVSEHDILDGLVLQLVLGPDAGLPGVAAIPSDAPGVS